MKTRSALILTGLLIYLLFLLVKLPASVAYPLVKNSINGPEMVGIKGTLWSGQATSMQVMNHSFQDVYWEFHPLALLVGSMDMDIDIRDSQYPFKADISTGIISGDLEAQQVHGKLPAGILQQFPALALISLSGELHINIKRLLLVDNEPRAADGEILLSQAYLQQPLQTKIGNILLNMTDKDDQVQVKIKDQQAPIAIDGILELQAGHKYSFSAKLKPGANADNSLISMLRNVSRIDPDGTMNIQYKGVY
jgi:hypothetical protein